jgi:hypothetical protein
MRSFIRLLVSCTVMLLLTGCQSTGHHIGDACYWANQNWHILVTPKASSDYLTLISDQLFDPLSDSFSHYTLFDELVTYDQPVSYDQSALAQYLNQTIKPQLPTDDLVEIDGYAIRLPQLAELQALATYQASVDTYGLAMWQSNRIDWLVEAEDGLWTMTPTATDKGCLVCGESRLDCSSHFVWYVLTSDNQACYLKATGNTYPVTFKIVVNVKINAITF